MTTRRSHLLLLSSVLCTALALGGCASTHTASSEAMPSTVVAAANANPELSTFAALVKQAGLESALEGAGPVTVFAPSDTAFKALPQATLDKLGKDPEQLKYVLSYHVVPAALKSADIDGSQAIATSAGAKVTVSKAGEFVTVDDGLVTKADIVASNGVVHVIDRVLTPPKK